MAVALERLAIFTDTWIPQVNGVSRTLARLVHECERRGIETLVVTPDDGSAFAAGVTRWPARPFWAYPQLAMATPSGSRARTALQQFQPTLVHVATPFGVGLSGRHAARTLGIPLVTSFHTHFTAYLRHYALQRLDAISWPFLRWFHNGGARTLVPTSIVARELAGQGFGGLRVWGRGIDAVRFSPAHRSSALRARIGCSDDCLLVGYVGRLAPEKGIDVAMAAMAPLLKAHPDRLRFVLVGDGPSEERLRVAAPPGVTFLGRQEGDALSAWYASMDVFVLPSTTETFGNVVLEAMASGVAVVSHAEGATTEFAHEGTSLPVNVTSASAISEAILRLLQDSDTRRRLALAGREEALRRGWPQVWDQLFTDYADVLGRQGRSERRHKIA